MARTIQYEGELWVSVNDYEWALSLIERKVTPNNVQVFSHRMPVGRQYTKVGSISRRCLTRKKAKWLVANVPGSNAGTVEQFRGKGIQQIAYWRKRKIFYEVVIETLDYHSRG